MDTSRDGPEECVDIVRTSSSDLLSMNLHRRRSNSIGSRGRGMSDISDSDQKNFFKHSNLPSESTPLLHKSLENNDIRSDKAENNIACPATLRMLWLAACAELNSEHVVGRAIVQYVSALSSNIPSFVQPTNFQAATGKGINCNVDGEVILLRYFAINF